MLATSVVITIYYSLLVLKDGDAMGGKLAALLADWLQD